MFLKSCLTIRTIVLVWIHPIIWCKTVSYISFFIACRITCKNSSFTTQISSPLIKVSYFWFSHNYADFQNGKENAYQFEMIGQWIWIAPQSQLHINNFLSGENIQAQFSYQFHLFSFSFSPLVFVFPFRDSIRVKLSMRFYVSNRLSLQRTGGEGQWRSEQVNQEIHRWPR